MITGIEQRRLWWGKEFPTDQDDIDFMLSQWDYLLRPESEVPNYHFWYKRQIKGAKMNGKLLQVYDEGILTPEYTDEDGKPKPKMNPQTGELFMANKQTAKAIGYNTLFNAGIKYDVTIKNHANKCTDKNCNVTDPKLCRTVRFHNYVRNSIKDLTTMNITYTNIQNPKAEPNLEDGILAKVVIFDGYRKDNYGRKSSTNSFFNIDKETEEWHMYRLVLEDWDQEQNRREYLEKFLFQPNR